MARSVEMLISLDTSECNAAFCSAKMQSSIPSSTAKWSDSRQAISKLTSASAVTAWFSPSSSTASLPQFDFTEYATHSCHRHRFNQNSICHFSRMGGKQMRAFWGVSNANLSVPFLNLPQKDTGLSKNSHELAFLCIRNIFTLAILYVPTEPNPRLYAVGDSSDFCKLMANWSFKHGSAIQQVGWYFRLRHTHWERWALKE